MGIEQHHEKLHRDRRPRLIRLGRLTLTALAGLGGLAIAPIAHAEDTIPFGAPLPGTPIAPVPDASSQEPPPSTPAPIEVEVLEAPRPPAPAASDPSGSGWVVEEGAGPAVTVVQEPPAATAIAPQPTAPSSFFEPVVPSQGRYAVYALGDNLGLFEQVRQLSPTAAFVTYRGQTAVRAGVFDRPIDAEARVRELSQRGISAEIGDAPADTGAAAAIAPRSSGSWQPVANRPTTGDPSAIFANFATPTPDMAAPPSGMAPLPVAGRRLPPLGNTNRSRSLPEPPPAPLAAGGFDATNPGSQIAPPSPSASPSFRAAAIGADPSTNAAPTGEAYFVLVTGDPTALPQLINQLSELGIPASSVFPNESGGVRIGPFADKAIAEQWQSRLRSARWVTEIMQNGWVVDSSNR